MKKFTKVITVALAIAMLSTAMMGCSKKKKSIPDAIEALADKSGAETVEIEDVDDIEDFAEEMEDLKPSDLEDGYYAVISGDVIRDAAEEADAEAMVGSYVDLDTIDSVSVFMKATLDEDDIAASGGEMIACIKFTEADAAVDIFKLIDSMSVLLNAYGLDLDDLSEDEYDFDKKNESGHFIVNINLPDFFEAFADEFDKDIEELEEALEEEDLSMDDFGNVVCAIVLDGDTIVISAAYGDDFVDDIDGVYSAAGLTKPSSVESDMDAYMNLLRTAVSMAESEFDF